MSRGLYIAGTEPRSGKSVLALGLMEMLAGGSGKIGLFRPVSGEGSQPDGIVRLVHDRYGLDISLDQLYGCTYGQARELLAEGREEDLLKQIMGQYKALEQRYELILCVGSDFTGAASPLGFEFDVDVANNLGCGMVPVFDARERDLPRIVDATRAVVDCLRERGSELFALVINRVAPELMESLAAQVMADLPEVPIHLLPELPVLALPSVGEITSALGAERLSGGEESYTREVRNFKVAAMELPHFLDHLEEGSLIIVPGDRSDIILGSLLADASNTYPHLAGLILTGGLKPAPQVARLIQGLRASPVPVLLVGDDTYGTALKVSALQSGLSPENPRKIAAALGLVESHIEGGEVLRRLARPRPVRVTPLMFEYEIIQRAKSRRRHIVLPEGTEERILRAAEILRMRDVVDITLLGAGDEIREKAASLGIDLSGMKLIDPLLSERRAAYGEAYYQLRRHKGVSPQMAFDLMADGSYFGTMMVHLADADGMVSGSVHTTQHTIRPALEIIKTRPGCSIVSSVFFICLADRVRVFGDCAVNPDPDSEQLADIAVSSAETARAFGIEPRVAMLSYSTGDSGKGAEVDKVREATRLARLRAPELKIEGPIQYDAAVDGEVARTKLPGSEVAGRASVLIFPDLNTGNNTYKAVQRAAKAVAIGPVLQGLNKPVNDLSRGCSVTDIVNTVAITAIQAQ